MWPRIHVATLPVRNRRAERPALQPGLLQQAAGQNDSMPLTTPRQVSGPATLLHQRPWLDRATQQHSLSSGPFHDRPPVHRYLMFLA
jgi:hypothetical protein